MFTISCTSSPSIVPMSLRFGLFMELKRWGWGEGVKGVGL
jgi:hypothetical protein